MSYARVDGYTYDIKGRRFKSLQRKVANRLVGKPVPPEWQHKYGKTYSKEEAMTVGAAVAGSRFWKLYGKRVGSEIISRERRRSRR